MFLFAINSISLVIDCFCLHPTINKHVWHVSDWDTLQVRDVFNISKVSSQQSEV